MKTFKNPVTYVDGVKRTNPDPFILEWCGKYYCYSTDEYGVNVSVSENLVYWTYIGFALEDKEHRHYWAPSVLYWNGKFYMYYSSILVDDFDCHSEHLKVAISEKPEGPFVYEKTFFDEFSIDSHPYIRDGELYMFYSVNNWIGTEDKVAGTVILIDKMISPTEFEGNPRLALGASIPQEIYSSNRFGDGRDWYTIEGACTIERNNKSYLLYSANAYENVDYFVGTAISEIYSDMFKMKWEKIPNNNTWNPLLKKNDDVEGTGHNTVAKAPNMVDDYIVYHGRDNKEELIQGIEQRAMRIDPLYFNGDEIICKGPTSNQQNMPSKPFFMVENILVNNKKLFCDAMEYCVQEFWVCGKKEHTGMKYSIYIAYENSENYIKMTLYSGRKEFELICCKDNISTSMGKVKVFKEFDYVKPHKIVIVRMKNYYHITIEDRITLEASSMKEFLSGKIGFESHFSEVKICSMKITNTVNLIGADLIQLSDFYEIKQKVVLEKNLFSLTGEFTLERVYLDLEYQEELQFEILNKNNEIKIYRNKELVVECKNILKKFSIISIINKIESSYIVNGKYSLVEYSKENNIIIIAKGLGICNYRYTKK